MQQSNCCSHIIIAVVIVVIIIMFTDRDYVVTSKETGSVSHALLPPSGEIILELLRYIWSLWEDPVDVSYNCNSHVIVT